MEKVFSSLNGKLGFPKVIEGKYLLDLQINECIEGLFGV